MGLAHSPRIVTDGMALVLDAANVKSYPGSGNTWIDLSGSGRNGTLTNGPVFNSSNGGNISFDGANDRIVISSTTINYSSGGTFEIWFKTNSSTIDQGFMSHNQAYPYINLWMPGTAGAIPANAGKMRWEVLNAVSTGVVLYSTTIFVTNRWYHVVGTFDTSNTGKIYINGTLDNQSTGNTVPNTSTSIIYVGDYGIGNYPSNANISIAKIYNRALTESEVKQNFNALRGRFGI